MKVVQQRAPIYKAEKLMDHQGIQWPNNELREQNRKRRPMLRQNFRCRNGDPPVFQVQEKFQDQMYSHIAFHGVTNMREAHFQSRYTLTMGSIPNLLLHSYRNKLIFYDCGTQKQESLILEDQFSSIGIAAQDKMCAIPGMSSDLILVNLENKQQELFQLNNQNQFTNHVVFYQNFIVVCDNGKHLKIYDYANDMKLLMDHQDIQCVNLACVNSDQLIAYCADRLGISIFDAKINKIVMDLKGHSDYGFAVDFNPIKPYELATGSQDLTSLIYDIRNPKQPLQQLKAKQASIYNVTYAPDGKHLFIGEADDFVQIVDSTNYDRLQIVDFFGSVSGIAVDPNNEDSLYFGVHIDQHEGIFQMNRKLTRFSDWQGITWQTPSSREAQFHNRLQVIKPKKAFNDKINYINQPDQYEYTHYKFNRFHQTNNVKANHFQLLNNLVLSNSTLIFPYYDELNYYDTINCIQKTQNFEESFLAVGMDIQDSNVIISGLQGNIAILDLINGQINYHKLAAEDCIINSSEFYDQNKLIQCDNDKNLKLYTLDRPEQPFFTYNNQTFTNNAAIQGSLIVMCLDAKNIPILDINSRNIIHQLKGHSDYNFSVNFNPLNENQFATGSQDTTCRVWDMRQLKESVAQICGLQESMYAVKYIGDHLICQEAHDYLHILDQSYLKHQIIEFFGQTMGTTGDGNVLYFETQLREREQIADLKEDIRRCKDIVSTISEKGSLSSLEDYQSYSRLNEGLKLLLQKSLKFPEKLMYPINPEQINLLGCSVSLQASHFNNLVEMKNPIFDDQLILEKKKFLGEMYQKSKQHPYFTNGC